MKRIFGLILALCMLFTFCCSTTFLASAEETNDDVYYMDAEEWYNDWDYEDGIIYGYYGDDKEVVVPSIAPDGVYITMVFKGTFANNKVIEKVTVSEGIELIDGDCFKGCSSLKEVILPSTLTSFSWGNNFVDCTSLKSITIPGGISEIPVSFASGCTALEEVIFTPSGNDLVIRGFAFNGTGLTKIVLPNNVKEVHATAFYNTKSNGDTFKMYIANPDVKLGGGKDNFGAEIGNKHFMGIAPGFEHVKPTVYVNTKATQAINFMEQKKGDPPFITATTKAASFFNSLPEMAEDAGIAETAADWDEIYKLFFAPKGEEPVVNQGTTGGTGSKQEEVVVEEDEGGLNMTTVIIILAAAFVFIIIVIGVVLFFVLRKNKKVADVQNVNTEE